MKKAAHGQSRTHRRTPLLHRHGLRRVALRPQPPHPAAALARPVDRRTADRDLLQRTDSAPLSRLSALTVLHSQDKVTPRVLAFWGLIIKLALLPIFLIMLILTIIVPLDSSNGNVSGFLMIFLILPLDAGVYCLMLVSSFHGFAVTKRLLAEQTIPSATVKRLRKMHAVPIADLVAAIWLYVLLRRLDSVAPASSQDA